MFAFCNITSPVLNLTDDISVNLLLYAWKHGLKQTANQKHCHSIHHGTCCYDINAIRQQTTRFSTLRDGNKEMFGIVAVLWTGH